MRLVLASNNRKKLGELQALLAPARVELIAQGALDIEEAEEPFHTFVENALAKARHAAMQSGGAAIADDSGLCVDALGGEPGVNSAHFAAVVSWGGEREAQRAFQDAANNALLLERLQGAEDRRARFVTTLVAVRSAEDPEPLVAVGRWFGEILHRSAGSGGFGYDPLMYVSVLGCAVAEMTVATKNAHSHRAIAAAQMLVLMREAWRLG